MRLRPPGRWSVLLLAFTTTLAAASGCSENGVAPTTGSISVTVQTMGAELDPDGYTASVDGGPAAPTVGGVATLAGVAPGVRSVRLDGVRFNCRLTAPDSAPAPISVEVRAGETAEVALTVSCSRTRDESPTWTADGRIVFMQYADSAGTALVSVTPSGAGLAIVAAQSIGGDAALSPDGQQIAFALGGYGFSDIAIAPLGGSGVQTTVSGGQSDDCPAWSPDGRQIAFTGKTGNHPNSVMYSTSADGTGTVKLSPFSEFAWAGSHSPGSDFCPAFTPDGTSIVFYHTPEYGERFTHDPADVAGMWAMSPDGSNRRLLDSTLHLTDVAWFPPRVAISPDNQRWAYAHGGTGSTTTADIFVRSAAGGPAQQLTADGRSVAPAWSPDGSRIAYLRLLDDSIWVFRPRLYVMNADGTNATAVPTALVP